MVPDSLLSVFDEYELEVTFSGFCVSCSVLMVLLLLELCSIQMLLLGSLRKLRRQRQRERHQTKGLMNRTIALHVRLKPWYIS